MYKILSNTGPVVLYMGSALFGCHDVTGTARNWVSEQLANF